MKHLQPTILAAGLALLAYAAVIVGSTGAENVLGFLAGLFAFSLLICIFSDTSKRIAARPASPEWSRLTSRFINCATVIFLIWHGAWATGIALFFALMFGMVLSQQADELRQKNAADKEVAA